MLDRVARADPDAASTRGVERLERRRERVDVRDKLGVREWPSRSSDGKGGWVALESAVEMIDGSQGALLRCAIAG